jgi:hypothetical protein
MKIKLALVIILTFTLLHLLLIADLIPAEIAWGGHLERNGNFYFAEVVALLLNALLVSLLLMKGKYLKQIISEKTMHILLWAYTILFVINTLGNILATTWLEKSFSLFTITLVILLVRINKKTLAPSQGSKF